MKTRVGLKYFVNDCRFGYWAYNLLYRKRLLSQDNFYIKQYFGDLSLTIDELRKCCRTKVNLK